MELRHLRTFIAVTEEASITAAARRLHIAQPAITRQIRQLEASVGTQLFERSPQGVTPTAAGVLLEPEARRLVAQADALVDDLRNDRTKLGGTLRIAMPEEGLGPLVPVVLAAYRAAHPNVTLTIDDQCDFGAIEQLSDRRHTEHDIAVWITNPEHGRLTGTGVYTERLQLAVASDSDLARTDAEVPIHAALDMPFVDAGSFMTDFAHPLSLSSLRNGSSPRFHPRQVLDADELVDGLAAGVFVACMTPSTQPIPGVKLLELDTATHVDIGVISHDDEQRQHVKNFANIAHTIGTQLYDLVPEAGPPSTATHTFAK